MKGLKRKVRVFFGVRFLSTGRGDEVWVVKFLATGSRGESGSRERV